MSVQVLFFIFRPDLLKTVKWLPGIIIMPESIFQNYFVMYTYNDIAMMIDHSLLTPSYTDDDIIRGCKLADKYQVATVCVRPSDVTLAVRILEASSVKVTTVIGFPHGSNTTATKIAEAQEAIENGCKELDVVLNIGKFQSCT